MSVDGGGTKTEFCIAKMTGDMLFSFEVGSTNYKSVGLEEVHHNIKKGYDILLQKFNIGVEDIKYTVFGIAGIDSSKDYDKIKDILCQIGVREGEFYLGNDGVLAFYAGATQPGIAVISGTGSIILGIGADKQITRVGGWGYNFSDEGSGYWIGAKALSYALLYADGCFPYSPLFDRLKTHFCIPDISELPYVITELTDFFEIAKITKIIIEEAQKDDELSVNLLKEGASKLALLTYSLWNRMHFDEEEKVSIVFSGGVLKNKIYNQMLEDEIRARIGLEKSANIQFVVNDEMPVKGGIQLAHYLVTR